MLPDIGLFLSIRQYFPRLRYRISLDDGHQHFPSVLQAEIHESPVNPLSGYHVYLPTLTGFQQRRRMVSSPDERHSPAPGFSETWAGISIFGSSDAISYFILHETLPHP
jgi:hypothetical protein